MVAAHPLAIIQARMGSVRLPGKVMLPLLGVTLLERVRMKTIAAFGSENTVVAYPATIENEPIRDLCNRNLWQSYAWPGDERDVLSRFFHCAHSYRWHPGSVIVRVTADDPFKDPRLMLRVAAGERLDVERGAEAFTLAMLDRAHHESKEREHLTHAIFPTPPPAPPKAHVPWSIDTRAQYDAVDAVTSSLEFPGGADRAMC